MAGIILHLSLHVPKHLDAFSFFDLGKNRPYLDEPESIAQLQRVVERAVKPFNEMLQQLSKVKHPHGLQVNLALSGSTWTDLQTHAPDCIAQFRDLCDRGILHLLGMPFHNSVGFLSNRPAFQAQISHHQTLMHQALGQSPHILFNPGPLYQNHLAFLARSMGMKGVVIDAPARYLGARTPNTVYHPPHMENLPVLVIHRELSDMVNQHFSQPSWPGFPLSTEKYLSWLFQQPGHGIALHWDLSAIALNHPADSGMLPFLRQVLQQFHAHPQIQTFSTEAFLQTHAPAEQLDIPAFAEAPLINQILPQAAIRHCFQLREEVLDAQHAELIQQWSQLQDQAYFEGMTHEGHVHFPDISPYELYIRYMNILADIGIHLAAFRKSKLIQ